MVARVLFGESGQEARHTPPERVPSASYAFEDLEKDTDDASRILDSGAATVDSMSLTTNGAAGVGEADPRRIPVTTTTGASAGQNAVIVASDGAFEAFQVSEIAAGSYIKSAHPLVGTYQSGASVFGVDFTATVPASVYNDEDYVEQNDTLRVVWEYTLRGSLVKVQQQLRVVREAQGDFDHAGIRTMILDLYPDIRDRLPNADPMQLDRWIGAAQRLVYGHIRRKGLRPELLLGGDGMNDAIVYRTMEIAAENQCVPAGNDSSLFREHMGDRYTEIFTSMTTGKMGEETADLHPVSHTHTGGDAKGVRNIIRGL